MDYSQLSMLEVACKIMEEKEGPYNLVQLIEETLKAKGLEDTTGDLTAQLYIDITTSSKFVYMGNECWDLKNRQSLDEYDKDGSVYNEGQYEDDLEDEGSTDDFDTDDDTDYDDDEDEDDDEDSEGLKDYEEYEEESDDDEDYSDKDDEDFHEVDDEEFEDDDFDEDDYNDKMDDFEKLYDEK